ncbi:MAG: DUF4340 domain-containing protein, partial [Verrucomicrobiota bacterium]
TVILGIASIALAILTGWLERDVTTGKSAAASANVLVRFDPGAIRRVLIESKSETTVIESEGGGWFFKEPEVDRVDSRAMAPLFDGLNHMTVLDRLEPSEMEETPAQLGLEGDRAIRISISGESDEGEIVDEVLILGDSAPREGSLYARLGDREEIVVVEGSLRRWTEEPLATLRDRRVLSAPAEAIVQLGIGRSTGEVVVQRRLTPPQQDWAIAEPLQAWANPKLMDELLTDLARLSIEEVIANADSGEPIPNPLPEQSAVLQVRVLGIEEPLTIYLKEVEPAPIEGAPARVEVRMSDRPGVYRLSSRILEDLPGVANDLRDRTLARIPMSYLRSITIESRIDPRVFLKSATTGDRMSWDVMINDKFLPANLNQIGGLVSGVNEAAILDFASDDGGSLADYGLQPPAQAVRFDLQFPGVPDEEGNPGQVQEVARILQLGWKEGEENRLFANFRGEPYIYELDPTFAGLIPTHPIKWRSLGVLTFNQFHLRSITREQPGKEKLKLTYDYRRDDWEAVRSGVDVSSNLDKSAATLLRNRLGSLTASGWFLSLGSAYEALRSPTVSFEVVTSELDAATGEPREVTRTIHFAPSTRNVYFGIVEDNLGTEGSRDVFFIDHETYRDFIRPITTSRAVP